MKLRKIVKRQSGIGNREGLRPAEPPGAPDNILEGLPAGVKMSIKVRAVNETGPGPFGEPIEATIA